MIEEHNRRNTRRQRIAYASFARGGIDPHQIFAQFGKKETGAAKSCAAP
jgi:succinate dehydrogenase flavin-adding protein (antitoxin of CptAB toxin-antitoxin module)